VVVVVGRVLDPSLCFQRTSRSARSRVGPDRDRDASDSSCRWKESKGRVHSGIVAVEQRHSKARSLWPVRGPPKHDEAREAGVVGGGPGSDALVGPPTTRRTQALFHCRRTRANREVNRGSE
jgi:hypothetical protein